VTTPPRRCPFGDDCPWQPGYPAGYTDPACEPGEDRFDHFRRVMQARSQAILDAFNAHLPEHPMLAGLHFEYGPPRPTSHVPRPTESA
jgi:hypothetical protein